MKEQPTDQPMTLKFVKLPVADYEQNLADRAVDCAAHWVYAAPNGQYNGVPDDSPFAGVVVLGVYTAGTQPGVTIADGDKVQLISTASLYMTKEPSQAHRTREQLAARLEELAQEIRGIELPGPDGVVTLESLATSSGTDQ